jgi:hypothetical protein
MPPTWLYFGHYCDHPHLIIYNCIYQCYINNLTHIHAGPLMVAEWLRYCATNRKVAGSIPQSAASFHSEWFVCFNKPVQ